MQLVTKRIHLQMKIRTLILAAGVFSGASMITSCLDDNEYEQVYNLETSIRSVSLKTLNIDRVGKDKEGKDSAYVDTINCSHYPFTINHYTRKIENKDSLPVGTHNDKVVIKLISDTGWNMYKKKNDKGEMIDTLWTEEDSINFTQPVEFKVVSFTLTPAGDKFFEGKPYFISVNVHKQVPDSLTWRMNGTSLKWGAPFADGTLLQSQKSVYADGKVYLFGDKGGTVMVKYAKVENNALTVWTDVDIASIADIKINSAVCYDNKVYFMAGTKIYNVQDATATEVAAESDMYKFYAEFPVDVRNSSVSLPLHYNKEIVRTVALAQNIGTSESDTTAVVMHRLSTEDNWNRVEQANPLTCPNMENISMLYYDGNIYSFGGGLKSAGIEPFGAFYSSKDYGLTWNKVKRNLGFPSEFAAFYQSANGCYSSFSDINPATGKDNFIWIIWNDGTYSQGRVNRLGFNPKW